MPKLLSYFKGLDIISIGTKTSKNPLVLKWLQRADPLLVLLAFQMVGLFVQAVIFFLPLNAQEEEVVTIVGTLNFAFTMLNTALFIHRNKDDLP